LVVALLILVVISIIGIAAMRTSIFNTKISTSAQGATMTFQAAESALAALYMEISVIGSPLNQEAISQLSYGVTEPIKRCVTKDDLYKPGDCGSERFDERGLIEASSRLAVRPRAVPCSISGGGVGDQVSGGGGARALDYEFVGVGYARLEALNIESFNVQEFAQCIPTPDSRDGSNI
jgi:type IV pilus assembly protein PilX